MPRLNVVNPDEATGKTKDLLDAANKKMGKVPNILKGMANSPGALGAYMGMSGAVADGALDGKTREAIALALGEENNCHYCLAAHTVMGKMQGLDQDEMLTIRGGKSPDPKRNAAVVFALKVQDTKGFVSDDDIQRVRDAGWDDAAIADIVAVTALNIYTNFFNHVNDTEVDFPEPPAVD
jgi:uncharacterized peroxidase-related enzyme